MDQRFHKLEIISGVGIHLPNPALPDTTLEKDSPARTMEPSDHREFPIHSCEDATLGVHHPASSGVCEVIGGLWQWHVQFLCVRSRDSDAE